MARRCGEKDIFNKNAPLATSSDHFLKWRCGKIARRCGEKHICKSKCTKHSILGPLFEVAMWKNCTPLWREAHFEVKMYKTQHSRTTFWSCDVEKLHAAVARSTFWSQNAKKLTLSGHFLTCRCRTIVEKWHAAVAPSTFTSQNVQNTCVLHHFWRFHFASSLTN